jgi:AcrR family transcriptional regulator
MARPKEFDQDVALEAATSVFREHGYAATSAGMLTDAMNIGRQSLYDTFGDKWQLYCFWPQRYGDAESRAHWRRWPAARKRRRPAPDDGAGGGRGAQAFAPGISSISEFGDSREDLSRLHEAAGRVLRNAVTARIREAQQQGDVPAALDAGHVAAFLLANVAGIRLAARGGADDAELEALGRLALQALR